MWTDVLVGLALLWLPMLPHDVGKSAARAVTSEQKVRLAALVRAKAASQATPAAADRAAALRLSLKRLNDAYVYGAMADADYRTELATLKEGLARVEGAPDEARIVAAIRLAQDLPALLVAFTTRAPKADASSRSRGRENIGRTHRIGETEA